MPKGGARKGAGRPPKDPADRTFPTTLHLRPYTLRMLRAWCAHTNQTPDVALFHLLRDLDADCIPGFDQAGLPSGALGPTRVDPREVRVDP